jgi:hypothetical protein
MKGTLIRTGEHPLRDLAGVIWGINILRTGAAIRAAPPSVRDCYRMVKKMPSFRCCCCGTESTKVGGMAVLRIVPPVNFPSVQMIPMAMCEECLRDEPVDNKLGPRIYKTLTGAEPKPFKVWKEMLH